MEASISVYVLMLLSEFGVSLKLIGGEGVQILETSSEVKDHGLQAQLFACSLENWQTTE